MIEHKINVWENIEIGGDSQEILSVHRNAGDGRCADQAEKVIQKTVEYLAAHHKE